jgi:hypothetical protein
MQLADASALPLLWVALLVRDQARVLVLHGQ